MLDKISEAQKLEPEEGTFFTQSVHFSLPYEKFYIKVATYGIVSQRMPTVSSGTFAFPE